MVCGGLYRAGGFYTCSGECHERLVDALVEEFGEFKKIIDAETGGGLQGSDQRGVGAGFAA